jgi:hypothetical protein
MLKKIIVLIVVLMLSIELVNADYHWILQWDKVTWAVTVFDNHYKEMKKKWYTKTRILDLLAIQSMECNLYNWNCLSSSDVWFFQINQIHRKQYKKSVKLLKQKKYWELYNYQLTYANWLVDSYEKWLCSEKSFNEILKIRTNKERVGCIGRMYNWHPKHKKIYWKILWKKREMIKIYINNLEKIWKQ